MLHWRMTSLCWMIKIKNELDVYWFTLKLVTIKCQSELKYHAYMSAVFIYRSTVDAGKNDPFCPVLLSRRGRVTMTFPPRNFLKKICLFHRRLNFKHILFMSVLYASFLFLSYKPLKFGILSYTAVFLCGVYCIEPFQCMLYSY